jgi:hypothetical protein
MVSKRRDHPYRSGRPDWVRVKNPKRPQKITFDKMREWVFAAS